MEESPYVPNSIPPALGLVFGSSNYGDAIRMQRPFGSQVSSGKELNLSNLSASSFGLRPMESYGGLPTSLVHLQNPFLHPALDPRLPFGSAGAFRPVVTSTSTSTASVTNVTGEVDRDRGVKSLPSAFTPPNNRRSKLTTTDSSMVVGGMGGGENSSGERERDRDRDRSSSSGGGGVNSSNNSSGGGGFSQSSTTGGGGGGGDRGMGSSSSSSTSSSSSSVIVASSQSSSSQVINSLNHQANSHPLSSHPPGVLNLDKSSSYVNGQRHRSISPNNCSSSTSKEERLSEDFINERNEENGTPNSDLTDRSTPDTDTHLPNKRRRRGGGGGGGGGPEFSCPVCRMSVHPMELESHLLSEVEQLMSLSRLRRPSQSMRMVDEPSTSTSQDSPSAPNHAKKDSPAESSTDSRWEVYNRVRSNRHSRLRLKTRRRREESGGAHVTCPVCQIPLQGSNQQLSAHVETCLRKNGDMLDEDEPVDIEGDGDGHDMEDYDWHAHRRGPSATNISPNYSVTALNMTTNTRRRDEDSLEVVVDGDDESTYGHAQYTESDIQSTVLRTSNNSPHHDSNILQDTKPYLTSAWAADEESSGGDDGSSNSHLNQTMLVKALKGRIRELERELKGGPPAEGNHCLICMDKYKKPVVSISCWHVHCEECWLRTLGAKKLCPQCNMITSASDLRRIFL